MDEIKKPKVTSFSATKQTQRIIEELRQHCGENASQVITRALQHYHFAMCNKNENKK
jgi:hypothetical protein